MTNEDYKLEDGQIDYLLPLTEDELNKIKSLLENLHDEGSSFGDYDSKELKTIKDRIRNLEGVYRGAGCPFCDS